MTAAAASQELQSLYPALHGLDPRELAEALSGAQLVSFSAGTALFGAELAVPAVSIVLRGSIGVRRWVKPRASAVPGSVRAKAAS